MRRRWYGLAAAFGVATACAREPEAKPVPEPASVRPAPLSAAEGSYLLVNVAITPATTEVREARRVPSPLPKERAPVQRPWRVDVEDAARVVLFSQPLPAANVLRGEFAGADGRMEAVHFRTHDAHFALRVPDLAGAATLRFWGAAASLAPDDLRSAGAPDSMVELGHCPYPGVR